MEQMSLQISCMVGDTVWGIKRNGDGWFPQKGVVSKMMVERMNKSDTTPTLVITIHGVCYGEWGKKVFGSREEAESECKRRNENRKAGETNL